MTGCGVQKKKNTPLLKKKEITISKLKFTLAINLGHKGN